MTTDTITNPTSKNTFQNLGKTFQEKVMQALIMDRVWAANFVEVFEVDSSFEYAELKLLANRYIGHYNQYKEFPSLDLLISVVKEDFKNMNDALLKERMVSFLKKVKTNNELGDLGWVKDKAFSFCRQQQVKRAILESSELAEDEEKYDVIVEKMKKAISSGIAMTDGLDYINDIDARYSETYRRCVGTGISHLDDKKMLNGGLGAGEIGIVVAPTGVGKSHALVHFGAQALLKGKNVLHYTLELNERIIGIRYDSHMVDISSTDCVDHQDTIRKFFETNAATLGKLRIKNLPSRNTTVNTLRAHMEKLKLKDFSPDLLLVDYAGIMRSSNKYDLLRIELKEVIQELRDFAVELDIPVWTALQSNKEGSNSDIVDLSNMAESYAQASIADVVLGISRKSQNKATGMGSLFVAKNRAGMDGVLYNIHMDTAKSRIRILSDNEDLGFEKVVEQQLDDSSKTNGIKAFQKAMQENKHLFRQG